MQDLILRRTGTLPAPVARIARRRVIVLFCLRKAAAGWRHAFDSAPCELCRVKLRADEQFISGSSSRPETIGSGLAGDGSHLPEDSYRCVSLPLFLCSSLFVA